MARLDVLAGLDCTDPPSSIAHLRRILDLPSKAVAFYAFGAPRSGDAGEGSPRHVRVHCEPKAQDWWHDYCADGDRRMADPVRAALRRGMTPVYWNDFVPERDFARSPDSLWQQLRDHRIAAGVSVPIHDARSNRYGSFSILHFGRREPFENWLCRHRAALAVAAYAFHLSLERGVAPVPTLTRRERECLALVAEGLSSKRVAVRLNLSSKTVDLHLSRACRRLGATNRTQAVARAVASGALRVDLT